MEEEQVDYSDAHRLFVQAFVSRAVVSDAEAKDLFRRCRQLTEGDAEAQFPAFLSHVNSKLNMVDMDIRSGHSDKPGGGVMWVLINTNGDEVAQMATEYTPDEIAFFKRVTEVIVTADDEAFEVSSNRALQQTSKISGQLSKAQAQKLLDRLASRGWLQYENGIWSLGVRSILELRLYLKNEYEENVRDCVLCKEMVTRRGECCASPDCDARIHDRCALRYFSAAVGSARERGCPACNCAWAGPVAQAGSEKAAMRRGSSPTDAGEIPSSQVDEDSEGETQTSDDDIQEAVEAPVVDEEENEEPLVIQRHRRMRC